MNQQIDISRITPEAVKQEVLKLSLTSPITVIPTFAALPATAFYVVFEAGFAPLAIAAVLLTIGVGNFMYRFFGQYQEMVSNYFDSLRKENEQLATQKLEDISNFLTAKNFPEAAEQVLKLKSSMASFDRVLGRKFQSGEFAYARYHSVAEQVFLNALANLEKIVAILEAFDSIDVESIKNRLGMLEKQLQTSKGFKDHLEEEKKSLIERSQIKTEDMRKVSALLTQNEKALTELERIASTLASADVNGEKVEANLTEAINTLNRLGADASKIWG
jgi:leucyl aminopeptidase